MTDFKAPDSLADIAKQQRIANLIAYYNNIAATRTVRQLIDSELGL